MKRRDLIKNISLGTVGVSILSTQEGVAQKIGTTPPLLPDVKDGKLKEEILRNQRLQAQKFFTPNEMKVIQVLCDIIIPADEKSGNATQAKVPEFIEFIVKDMPEHQVPMRGGIQWIDNKSRKMFNKNFHLATPSQRIEIVDMIAYPEKALPENSHGVAFFNLMRNLTATGFFTSEIGYNDLEYMGNTPNVWDGVPQDVLDQYQLSYQEWQQHSHQ